METTIQKWGNSLGLRLPKEVIKKQALKEGSHVILVESKEGIVIRPQPKAKKSLQQLVKNITANNLHDEMDWQGGHGNEVW
jgi:antitoxin MazE